MVANGTRGKRGALIVVEGLDRAGKSSQCEYLRNFLQESGRPVKYIRFPGISILDHRLVNAQTDNLLLSRSNNPHRKAN